MPIPVIYRKSSDTIATYNYTDIADGTGIIDFYGYNSTISGGTIAYHLGNNIIYSDDIEAVGTSTDTLNFNVTSFNTPRIVKGTPIVRFSMAGVNTGSGHGIYIKFQLQKISKGITTVFGSAISTSNTKGSAGSIVTNHTMPITLSGATKFKIGDVLRLSANIVVDSASTTYYIGIDPANREGAYVTPAATYPTKFELLIPFKIDQ